jgi:hypothetical protein
LESARSLLVSRVRGEINTLGYRLVKPWLTCDPRIQAGAVRRAWFYLVAAIKRSP